MFKSHQRSKIGYDKKIQYGRRISTLPTASAFAKQVRTMVAPGEDAVVLLHHESSDLVYQLAKVQFVDFQGSATLVLTAYAESSGKLGELDLRKIDITVSSFSWMLGLLDSASETEQRVGVGFKGNILPVLSLLKVEGSPVVIIRTTSMQVNK